MDSFDDLLEPSMRALEENPFDDPFAKRSNSPDPWSNYTQPVTTPDSNDVDDSDYGQGRSTPTGSFVTADQDERVENLSNTIPDPLDATAQADNETELAAQFGPHLTSSFIESIPPNFSQIETIRPTLPEELEPSIPAPSSFLQPAPLPPAHSDSTTSSFTSVVSDSPSPSVFAQVTSPLDSPASSSIGRSFAGHAPSGETFGGWRAAQDSWVNTPITGPSGEDSDDDKPIGRAIRPVAEPSPVSSPRLLSLWRFLTDCRPHQKRLHLCHEQRMDFNLCLSYLLKTHRK